jgi:hypothetical protein
MADGLSILVFNVLWSHVKTKDETYVHVVSLLRITFEYIYGSSAPNHPVCIVQSCVCEDTGQIVHSKTQRWSRIFRGEADHHPNDTATTVLSALDPDPTAMLSERYMLLLVLTGVGKWVAQHPETQHCADQHITVPS